MTLGFREKLLLFVVACAVVIFLGVWFLIMPMNKKISADNVTLSDVTVKWDQANNDVLAAKSIDTKVAAQFDKAKSSATALLPSLDKPSLNLWFNNIAANSGMTINSILISDAMAANLTDNSNGQATSSGSSSVLKAVVDYAMKNYADQYQGKTVNSKTPAGNLMMSQITMKMYGDYAGMLKFVDSLKASGRIIQVSALTVDQEQGKVIFKLSMNCYAAQKLDTSDNMFQWTIANPAGQKSLM